MSIQLWRTHWDSLTTFFKYPVELRRIVYTTNAIESLNAQLRKNIANRKVLPHDDAVMKLLFLNIRNFSNPNLNLDTTQNRSHTRSQRRKISSNHWRCRKRIFYPKEVQWNLARKGAAAKAFSSCLEVQDMGHFHRTRYQETLSTDR